MIFDNNGRFVIFDNNGRFVILETGDNVLFSTVVADL